MKKILFICQTNNALKGTEKAFSVLVDGLNKKYEVHYLAVEEEQPAIVNPAVTFHFLKLSEKAIPKMLHKVAHFIHLILGIQKTIKSVQPDIVISSLDEINIATGLLIKRHKPSIFIATVHTNPGICLTGIKKRLARMVFPRFHKVICVSEGIETSLHSIISNINSDVIYNPFKINQTLPEPITSLRRLIFIGNLTMNKGIHHLLRVLKNIPETNRPTLDVLGTGELESELETFCSENNLHNYVTFHGMQKDVFSYIEQSDALILPTYSEALPLVLIEALKTGIPVITSDANYGPREILAIKEPIPEHGYIKTNSGILLSPPSYTKDTIDTMDAPLTQFEQKLHTALTELHEFLVDETLCDRFDAENILAEWSSLLEKLYE